MGRRTLDSIAGAAYRLLDEETFEAIVLSTIDVPGIPGPDSLPDNYLSELSQFHEEAGPQYGNPKVFWPRAGLRIKPGFISYRNQ